VDSEDLIGRSLGGRFRVTRALKRGGMGAVYEATDSADNDRGVAIKVVKRALAEDDETIARFKRETRLLKEVKHPNVVGAIDAGDDDGLMWIAMELVDGVSLRERLDGRGRWPWMDTLPVIRQVALALSAVHRCDVIHRDLKPENIMLIDTAASQRQGAEAPRETLVKLVDFGVAKQQKAESDGITHMTGTGLVVGTPGYVAPELVIDGITDDPRSDLYAVGVTWFELITGQKPFTAKTPVALAMRHAHETPPTPSSLLPFAPVPAPVEALIMRLMEKTPQARPDSAEALVALIDALSDAAVAANTPMPSQSMRTSLGIDQKTLTAGDDIARTGVVPFSTPQRPSSAASAAASVVTPPTSLTPATAQHAAAPQALMPPSSAAATPTSAALSRPTVAVGVAAVVGVVIVSALVGGLAGRGERRDAREERRQQRTAAVSDVDRDATIPVIPPTSPLPPTLPTPPLPPERVAPLANVDDSPEVRVVDKRGERDRPPRRRRLLEPTTTPPVPATVAVGMLKIAPEPRGMGWKVSVDGGFAQETPRSIEVTTGTHTLVFEAPGVAPITRRVDVRGDAPTYFAENLKP
jgi:serine/threonine protein kinase